MTTAPTPKKKPGPKTGPVDGPLERVYVTLDEMTKRKLTVLGRGNMSKGIRAAADYCFSRYQQGLIEPRD